MDLTTLRDELKASLHDAAGALEESDFTRTLRLAVGEVGKYHPLRKQSTLTLTANLATYDIPADMVGFMGSEWGSQTPVKPWEPQFTRPFPLVEFSGDKLWFSPAPTALHLSSFGSSFLFTYRVDYVLDTVELTTLPERFKPLVLLRAQAEVALELAQRNYGKPISLNTGSGAKSGDPLALHRLLMTSFKEVI